MVNVSQDKNRIIAEALHNAICELREVHGITYWDLTQFNFYVGWPRFCSLCFHTKRGLKPIAEEREKSPWWRCWFK